MSAQNLDWIAVGLAVAGAAFWLGLVAWRKLRRPEDPKRKSGACGSACEGCVFAKTCGDKRG